MYKLFIEENISTNSLLKKVLKQYKVDADIVYNEYGKPYLKDNALYFNLSNCKKYTVCVVADKEIGVDIQKITMKESIIDRICTSEEQKTIKTAEDFTKIWVKKESYVKCLGMGIGYGLKNVDTLKTKGFNISKKEDYYICVYMKED